MMTQEDPLYDQEWIIPFTVLLRDALPLEDHPMEVWQLSHYYEFERKLWVNSVSLPLDIASCTFSKAFSASGLKPCSNQCIDCQTKHMGKHVIIRGAHQDIIHVVVDDGLSRGCADRRQQGGHIPLADNRDSVEEKVLQQRHANGYLGIWNRRAAGLKTSSNYGIIDGILELELVL
ncbi:hypothetical protein DUI87_29925 [Hirundo rustica rustica]|uniref:Uncharacterized protein n=1 Tax=Hirundo rustica rustica TaxID=333673 RepID=A0A3M0IYK4_HIRRU|nr:hypothetical protein DUI87_29925 [Hirundo rustica rustica]